MKSATGAGAGRLSIRRLELTDFRNCHALTLDCDSRHVVLTGENGAGKTNILEALSFLSPGRGLRMANLESVARNSGPGGWSVFALAEGYGGPVAIGTGLQTGSQGAESTRRVRINQSPARSNEDLLEHLRLIWLTPAQDGLFTGPAADRRRFLDRLVLAINPMHARHAKAFERAMRARNRLLGEGDPDPSWLDAIERQMTEAAAAIHFSRRELLSLFDRLIRSQAEPEGGPFPDVELKLESGFEIEAGNWPAAELENYYSTSLGGSRRADAAAGRTLEGPHRGDLLVTHKAKAMPARHCSTGEQKALLIGIVLAHAALVGEMTGCAPILLLDEIAAHLDLHRRSALFARIDRLNAQAWMTGTDKLLFDELGSRASYWKVAQGKIESG